MKKIFALFLLLTTLLCSSDLMGAPLRRPISPSQPMWIIHIDTWNNPDPERIIEMVPEDIRPYVCFNLSLSATDATCCNGPDVCDSWMKACAAKRVWAMIQCASGSHSRFSDKEFSEYERYFKEYPNFIGWNFAEQFWGFGDEGQPTFDERLRTFAHILDYCQEYGGYLVVSFTQAYFSSHMMPIAYMRNAEIRKRLVAHPENFICCEKYTMTDCFFDIESNCVGAYVGGYAGQVGIRFDACGWVTTDSKADPFVKAAGAIPIMEHVLLDGETVIDGPETIPVECSREGATKVLSDGYTRRNWEWFPHFVNINIDGFRKILDGTVRIMSREELVKRVKVGIINLGNTAYTAPDALYDGLYRQECDNWGRGEKPHKRPLENHWWFKSTGRYPAPVQCYGLADDIARQLEVRVKYEDYNTRWGDNDKKVDEFNKLFPEEYHGDIFAGRHENTWMTYNAYQYDDVLDEATNLRNITITSRRAKGVIPFKYNTCDSVMLSYAAYSMGVMKEFGDSITFYLSNYRNRTSGNGFVEENNTVDTIRIYGISGEANVKWFDRGSHRASSVSTNTDDKGVLTIVVKHNGPLDLTVNCHGEATDRLTDYTVAKLEAPQLPPAYNDTLQYEAECMDYKAIAANRTNGYYFGHARYQGQGFVEMGTNTAASLRDSILLPMSGTAQLSIRYQSPDAKTFLRVRMNNKLERYDLPQCSEWQELTVPVTVEQGTNVLMLYFGSSHKNVFIDCVKVFDYPTESTAITELPLSSPLSTDTAPTYDLSGRKVTTLKKGLYIRNGKKFFKN